MCPCLRWNLFRRFNSSQSCNIDTASLKKMYYKKGANVALGEKYKTVKLNNGVSVYMLDNDNKEYRDKEEKNKENKELK